MQRLAPTVINKPMEPLREELPLSNIRLKSQKQKEKERLSTAVGPLQAAPVTLLSLQQQEDNNLEFSFHPDQTLTSPSDSLQKRRQAKIFSIVHSAQRERSGSRSSNNSSWKQGRTGISLVSKEKRRMKESIEKTKQEDYSLGSMDSFAGNADSITLILEEKENKPIPVPLKIKQPQFLKSHPLRVTRMNGGCMSKLIAQRALQQRTFCHQNTSTKN